MFKKLLKRAISTFLMIYLALPYTLTGQTVYDHIEELKSTILKKEAQFWEAYNDCKVEEMISHLRKDLEFYHDKNGLTKGLVDFEKSLTNGLCINGPQLRREVKNETIEIYPLRGIGAIISGEHRFYVGDRPESEAKFTHLWTFQNDNWKLSRAFSYDHRVIPYENKRIPVPMEDKTLMRFLGKYQAPRTGELIFSKVNGRLNMKAGKMEMQLLPESNHKFFHEQRDLTFEFVSDESKKVIKVVIREGGKIVEEAVRVQ